MAPKLLWIGLGNMGRGMCKNLVEKGTFDGPLLIYNRTKQRAADLSAQLPAGTTRVVDSIEEGVAAADTVFTCVSDDRAVEQTYAAALGVADVEGKLFVDCSTIHPDATEATAAAVVARGAAFVAAPVFGAAPMAEAGQLIGVLAGPRAAVDRARPFFKGVMARAEIDMADEPYGRSTTLKVIGNSFVLNMVEQLAEGHTLAEKTGLGVRYTHQFVDSLFGGPWTAYSNRMLGGDYYKREEPLFGVDLARKDARHALSLAKTAGMTLKNIENADASLAGVKEHAGEKGDIAGIYGAVRKSAGLKYENDA